MCSISFLCDVCANLNHDNVRHFLCLRSGAWSSFPFTELKWSAASPSWWFVTRLVCVELIPVGNLAVQPLPGYTTTAPPALSSVSEASISFVTSSSWLLVWVSCDARSFWKGCINPVVKAILLLLHFRRSQNRKNASDQGSLAVVRWVSWEHVIQHGCIAITHGPESSMWYRCCFFCLFVCGDAPCRFSSAEWPAVQPSGLGCSYREERQRDPGHTEGCI